METKLLAYMNVTYNYGLLFYVGNNIYGNDMREALLRIRKEGSEEDAAYILMQRIFPSVFPALLVREGICYKDHAISELGIYGAYLRYTPSILTKLHLLLFRMVYPTLTN